jgi:hypothetical protein
MEKGVPTILVGLQQEGLIFLEGNAGLAPERPLFYCRSKMLETRAIKQLKNLHHTGEWVMDQWPSPADIGEGGHLAPLVKFLGSSEHPPVVFTWGSMLASDKSPVEMLRLALRVLRATDERGVIVGGWAHLDKLGRRLLEIGGEHPSVRLEEAPAPGGKNSARAEDEEDERALEDRLLAEYAREKVCFVSEVPYPWLFPQCACVVHHGGIGTSLCAIRCGVPSVITPIFLDQFDAAEELNKLGAGIGFTSPLHTISEGALSSALRECLESETVHAAAAAGAIRLRTERGELAAAAMIETFLRKEVQTQAWSKRFWEERQRVSPTKIAAGKTGRSLEEARASGKRPVRAAQAAATCR